LINKETVYAILESVKDPEIPVLSVIDMGIIRDVKIHKNLYEVVITPTYSGCPAMRMIEMNITAALHKAGIEHVSVSTVLNPAWTTDWMSEEGKERLKSYGIAPPRDNVNRLSADEEFEGIECPQCSSKNTEVISQFGSTPCKSLLKCKDCLEPFDYFKCH
jgi:ring-1,2-phenylacetyl-CoA epoxidase subunit PaaD